MLMRSKAGGESRIQQEKAQAERKKNLLVMLYRHLISCGYLDASVAMERECNIGLAQWEMADNMDLYYVLQDFEEYYELKFQRKPVLVKKNPNYEDETARAGARGVRKPPTSGMLPKIGPGSASQSKLQSQASNASSGAAGSSRGSRQSAAQHSTAMTRQSTQQHQTPKHGRKITMPSSHQSLSSQQEGGGDADFAIQGTVIQQQPKAKDPNEEIEEFFENRVLKPLPDYSYNPDLRELAVSIQNEIINANPNVRFTDIVGLTEAKRLLKEAVLMPMKYPHFFQGILEPWKGILLFGPPGTGKTMLAKAVATECRTTFFNISASTIVSKWRGDSEKLIKVLFDLARYHQPTTIFIDEIDSILSARSAEGEHEASRRMKTELLIQLDGLIRSRSDRVFLLAASNLPWELDMALLRRLEKRILVTLPTPEARAQMMRANLPQPMCQEDFPYDQFAEQLEGYSGSDLRLVCKEAAMKPLRRLMAAIELESTVDTINWSKEVDPSRMPSPGPITLDDMTEAMTSTKSSAQAVPFKKYSAWMNEFGSV